MTSTSRLFELKERLMTTLDNTSSSQWLSRRSSMANRVIVAVLGMLLAQPAWAQWVEVDTDWVELGTGDRGKITFYIDQTTIRKSDSGRQAWTMHSFEQPPTGFFLTLMYQSVKQLDEFDCAGERSKNMQSLGYSGPMGTGQVVWSNDDADRWTVVSPGSHRESLLRAACSVPLK
jgi:hypothetical protein